MKPKKKLSFTVKRSKWRSGHYGTYNLGEGETLLLNDQGYKCCLGFACSQLGYKNKISGYGAPSHLKSVVPGLSYRDDEGKIYNTEFTLQAIQINDNAYISQETRERRLIKLGEKYGINIKFVD